MISSIVDKFKNALESISPDSAAAYEQKMEVFAEHVNRTLEERDDFRDLIGPNPVEVMRNNHSNHAQFMLSQFRLKSAHAMVETIVWVYRTYISRGFSPRYFPIELTAWMDALDAYVDASCAQEIKAVYSLMIDEHTTFLQLSQSTCKTPSVSEDIVPYFKKYKKAVLKPDLNEAIQVTSEFVQNSQKIPVWWEQIIAPAMQEIGRLWEEGEITVGQEHLATSITQRVMSIFYPMILELPRERGTIVVSATPNELHEIGARIVADLLEIDGWNVHYMGANSPADSIFDFVLRVRPRFLCLSTSLISNLPAVASLVKQIKTIDELKHTHIVAGGQVYQFEIDLWKTVGADGYSVTATDCVRYINDGSREN